MLIKLLGVAFLIWWHHFLIVERKRIAARTSTRSERFWRATNELPFLAAIIIILAVTTKFA
jgi:putative membrane protein